MDYTGQVQRYQSFDFDFGGGADDKLVFRGPKGKRGLLMDYGVYNVTEVFAGGTTTPGMSIGTAADADHYGDDFDFGALANDSGGKSIKTTYAPGSDGWNTYMLIRELPADTDVVALLKAATGSGLTGHATPFVDVIWEK